MSDKHTINISDNEEEEDDPLFQDFRESNKRFQERLLEAQQASNEKVIIKDIEKKQSIPVQTTQSPITIIQQKRSLEVQIEKMESEIETLKEQLILWQKKREREATLSTMTPEERAKAVITESQQSENKQKQQMTAADLDSIFDYLFEIGQIPLHQNAAGFNAGMTRMEPQKDAKAKAYQHPDVLEQVDFTHITFTEVQNEFIDDDDEEQEQEEDNDNRMERHVETEPSHRKCVMKGLCYELEFRIRLCISPKLEITKLDFDVNTQLLWDAGYTLTRIKQERNLVALFRLLRHYGQLEVEKKRSFDFLEDYYKGTEVNITRSLNIISFSTRTDDIKLNLQWTYREIEDSHSRALDVNICDKILPRIVADVSTPSSSVRSDKFNNIMDQLPDKFDEIASEHGVVNAAQVFVGIILQEPYRRNSHVSQ